MYRSLLSLFILTFFAFSSLFTQNIVGVKLFGLSIHTEVENGNEKIFPRKLDNNGIFVFNLGATINYERLVYKDFVSIKVVQGLYSDCANKFAGFSHIGIRGRFF